MVEKCEIYQTKGSQGILGLGFDKKFLLQGWDLTNVENLPYGFRETLRLENMAGLHFGWFFIGGKSVPFKNQKTFGFLCSIILQ